MAQTEIHLKSQLQIYTDKYSEFETTLNKSNEVFAAFKSEMEKVIFTCVGKMINISYCDHYLMQSAQVGQGVNPLGR